MRKICNNEGRGKRKEAHYRSGFGKADLSSDPETEICSFSSILSAINYPSSFSSVGGKGGDLKMRPVNSVNILLIEDNIAEARLLQEFLKDSSLQQFSLVHAKRLGEGLTHLQGNRVDVVLLDLTLPDSQGLESLARLIENFPSLPIVVLTNTNDEDLAIASVRQGAQDYLVKRQVQGEILARSLRYAIERKHNLESLKAVNQALEDRVQERTAELMKAQEQNQLRSEFVSMISHDFRNPLNTILASAVLLQDHDQKLTQEKKVTLFQRIRSASKNMAQLLDEVLLIGEADSGQLHYQPSLVNLEVFCRQIVDEIQLSAGENYQVIFNISCPQLEAQLDQNLLRRILINLLENAIKYSPQRGIIQFDLISQHQTLNFCIQDQGIGIPQDSLNELFEPFYRAKNVGSIPGSGLGLAIVKHCVEAHGGQIWVNSQVGVGTTFIIQLPIANP